MTSRLPRMFDTLQVSRRTLIRRLADKGYTPEEKLDKQDPGPALAKKRLVFAREHATKSKAEWKACLQVTLLHHLAIHHQCHMRSCSAGGWRHQGDACMRCSLLWSRCADARRPPTCVARMCCVIPCEGIHLLPARPAPPLLQADSWRHACVLFNGACGHQGAVKMDVHDQAGEGPT